MISVLVILDAAFSGALANVCDSPGFPIHRDHVKAIAETLKDGQVVAFRPVNDGVKKLITMHEKSQQPSELLITGKGFLAGGKSSDLPFLAGRIPVDPRMSKKGVVLKSEEIPKMEEKYRDNLRLYPATNITNPAELEASTDVRNKCTEQGRLIIVEGGAKEKEFVASSLSEEISFEKTRMHKERPRNSICQYRKEIQTEKIKKCDSPTEDLTFDQYHVRYGIGKNARREVLLRNEQIPSHVFSYDQGNNCVAIVTVKKKKQLLFIKLQVFAYAFTTPANLLVYPDLVADYDILMFGLNKGERSYTKAIKEWLDAFYSYGVKSPSGTSYTEKIEQLGDSIKKALKPGSESGFPLPHSLLWEADLEEGLVNAFRAGASTRLRGSTKQSLSQKSGLLLFRMIRHNQESANYASPNPWEAEKRHPIIWRKKDGSTKCCLPQGMEIQKGTFLIPCGLEQVTFFPHIFWIYDKQFTYTIPTWDGKEQSLTYNDKYGNYLDAKPFATTMLEEILGTYDADEKINNEKRTRFNAIRNTFENPTKKDPVQRETIHVGGPEKRTSFNAIREMFKNPTKKDTVQRKTIQVGGPVFAQR